MRRQLLDSYHDDCGPLHGSFSRDEFESFGGRKKKQFPARYVVIGLMAFVVAVSSTILIASTQRNGVAVLDKTAQTGNLAVADKTSHTEKETASQQTTKNAKSDGAERQRAADAKLQNAMQGVATWLNSEEVKDQQNMRRFSTWVHSTMQTQGENAQVSPQELFEMFEARKMDADEARKEATEHKVKEIIGSMADWLSKADDSLVQVEQKTEDGVEKFYEEKQAQAHQAVEKAASQYHHDQDWLNARYGEIDGQLSQQAQAAKQRIEQWYGSQETRIEDMEQSLDVFLKKQGATQQQATQLKKDERALSDSAKKTLGDALENAGRWLEGKEPNESGSKEVNLGQGKNGDVPPDADAPPEPSIIVRHDDPTGPPPDADAPPLGGQWDPSKGAPPQNKGTK